MSKPGSHRLGALKLLARRRGKKYNDGTMNPKNVLAIAAAALLTTGLAGCSGKQFSWSNKPKTVPVTRPTSQDPNVSFAEPAPTPAPVSPAQREPTRVAIPPAPAPEPVAVALAPAPAPAPEPSPTVAPEPATPPVAPAKPIDKPLDLTQLINAPKVEPRRHEIEPVVTTMPVTHVRPTTPPPTASPTTPATTTPPVPAPTSAPTPTPAPTPTRTFVPPGKTAKPLGTDEVVAASVVQVNRQFITVDDILRPLAPQLDKLPKNIDEPTFRDQAARMIVREITGQTTRRLVVEEAEKRLVDDQKKMIDHEVKQAKVDMLAAAGGSITKLRQKLRAEGLTLEDALADYRRDSTFRLYLRHRFMPAIPVTRKMLWDYYRQNHEQFSTGHKVQMQILAAPYIAFLAEPGVKPSPAELAAAKAKARQVIDAAEARVTVGEDFTTIVKKYSRGVKASAGGLWPLMESGSFKETAVEKAAFGLAAGAVSNPIQTQHGWYLVKAVQVIPGRVVPFEDAQEKITETLRNRMYEELTDKYFQDLLKKSHIVRSPEFNQLALDRAVDRFWQK